MQAVFLAVVILVLVLSRLVEIRLWRAGRLSDRSAAILLLGRFPVLCFLLGVVVGLPPLLVRGLTALAAVPPVLFYRSMLAALQEQRERAP